MLFRSLHVAGGSLDIRRSLGLVGTGNDLVANKDTEGVAVLGENVEDGGVCLVLGIGPCWDQL